MTHGDVFVAERFGGWQEVVLGALAGAYDAKKRAFGPDAFDAVHGAVKAAAAGGGLAALEVCVCVCVCVYCRGTV